MSVFINYHLSVMENLTDNQEFVPVTELQIRRFGMRPHRRGRQCFPGLTFPSIRLHF